MKKSFTLLGLLLTFICVEATAQILTIKPFKLNEKQVLSKSSVYQENFNYSEFTLEKNEISKINQNINSCNIEFTLSNQKTLVAVLNKIDIWDKNFDIKNEKGEKIIVEKGNVFQGYLKGDSTSRVAVSIFNDAIDILIETKKGKYSLNRINGTYKFEDVVNNENNLCPVNDKIETNLGNSPNSTIGCKTFTIRVVTDLNILNYYSGNINTVYQRVVTIFNQMIIPYHEQSVGVKLASVNSFTSTPPFDYSNNSTLLNSFNSWYYANLSGANMGHLFTTVGFSGVIGTAYVNNICSGNQPHTGWSKVNDSYGYLVAAHEIGHNLGSSHTNSNSIMDPYVNSGYSFDAATGNLFRSGLSSCGFVDNSVPTNLQTSNIGTTTAILSWNQHPTATNYFVAYWSDIDNIQHTTPLSTNPFANLSNLHSGANYSWFVNGDCYGVSSYPNYSYFTTQVNLNLSINSTNLQLCPGVNTLSFTQTGVTNINNEFNIEISDINGVFNGNHTKLPSTDINGNLSFDIPYFLSPGTGYKLRISSTSPKVFSNVINLTIKPAPAFPQVSFFNSSFFCNNNPISVSVSNCNGTVSWSGGYVGTGNSFSIVPIEGTTFTATCVAANGCGTSKQSESLVRIAPGTKNSKILWEKSFGGTANDQFRNAAKTADGGYLLTGYSASDLDGNKTQPQRGAGDGMLIKIDANGNRLWEKVFGGINEDILFDILPTSDNNFLIVGQSFSGIGYEKQSINKGHVDAWIIKINPNGDVIWETSLGSTAAEYTGTVVAPTSDGGYIIGSSVANTGPASVAANGDRSQNLKNESWDYWIFKIDASGQKVWDKVYGGLIHEFVFGIEKATDNSGYYLVGQTNSASGAGSDLTTSARHDYDGWLLKIDNNGNKIFDKIFSGGTARSPFTSLDYSNESLHKIKALPDGNYLIQGFSNNHAGNEKSENSMGGLDMWLIKIAPDGTKISDKVFGGTNNEYEGDMIVLNDGSILLSSSSKSAFNVDRNAALKGTSDIWILKLDPNLNIIWNENFGGAVGNDPAKQETIYKILDDGNNNFILVGWADEAKGDRADTFGLDDGWVMKINIPSTIKPTISANTTLVCSGESITLIANGCTSNTLWSSGATINSVVVKPNFNDNTYRVNCITNANACIGLDSEVFRVNVAPNDLNLTGTAISGNKQAKGSIVSKEIINSGVNVNYKAGKSILLDKNQSFEAKTGSIFKAEIASCAIENGLLARYDFSNNILDQSGNNRNGLVNTALFTKDRYGNSNSALSFNGVNQYVTLGNWFNYQEFTVSFWLNAGATQTNAYAELIDNNHTGSRSWFAQQDNTSNNLYYFGAYGSPRGDVFFNLTSTWNHLTFVKGAGIIKVFLNGKLVNTATHGGTIMYDGTQNLILGAWYASGGFARFWKGSMDDLKLYNRALSDTEITTIFQAEAPNPSLSAGLFANYKFDGDANDISGKGNNGTINGGATFTSDRFGTANKALNFDGVDDHVSVTNNNTLSGFNEVTVSAWVANNLPNATEGSVIGKWFQQVGSGFNSYIMGLSNTQYYGAFSMSAPTIYAPNAQAQNSWVHLVYTHDATGDKLFINGYLGASNTNAGTINYSTTNLLLGADTNMGTLWRFFKGKIDDVRLYNRALSRLEVQQLYELEKQ